jgi:tRNA dimethylallyltransferase
MLLTILGPTACGKTRLAVHLAATANGEIISADSRQVYRNMDIGTGKDLQEYTFRGLNIPYHLIDITEAGDEYNLYRFVNDFKNAYRLIIQRNRLPVLCGGTGLYIEAVLKNFSIPDVPMNSDFRSSLANKSDEELTALLKTYKTPHNKTDTENRRRLIRALEIAHFSAEKAINDKNSIIDRALIFGINMPREIVRQRITDRLQARLKQGMIKEVAALISAGISPERLIRYGLEYKFITLYLTGKLSLDEMTTLLNIAIHQFAKRQMTWFRGMERRGLKIHWIDGMLPDEEKMDFISRKMAE